MQTKCSNICQNIFNKVRYELIINRFIFPIFAELIDCDKIDSGCKGGYMTDGYKAIEELGGLELESDYPYTAEDEKCSFTKNKVKAKISGSVNITSNETEMANWLVKHGPISIAINANAMQVFLHIY